MNEQLLAILVQALTAQAQTQPTGAQVPQPQGMQVPAVPTGMQTQPMAVPPFVSHIPAGQAQPTSGMTMPMQSGATQSPQTQTAQPVPVQGLASQGLPAAQPQAMTPAAPDANSVLAQAIVQLAMGQTNPAGQDASSATQPVPHNAQPVHSAMGTNGEFGHSPQPMAPAAQPAAPAVSLANLFAGMAGSQQSAMTLEQISTMSPDQINSNWEQVAATLDASQMQ